MSACRPTYGCSYCPTTDLPTREAHYRHMLAAHPEQITRHVSAESRCEWFALCENEPAGVVDHPVLGERRVCRRCADRFDLVLRDGEVMR